MGAEKSYNAILGRLYAAWACRDTMTEADWDALFRCVMDWDETHLVTQKIIYQADYPADVYRFCISWLKSCKYGYISNWSSSESDDDEKKEEDEEERGGDEQ